MEDHTTPVTEHMRRGHEIGIIPRDPHSHAAMLLQSEQEAIFEFQKMANRSILLARIPKEKMSVYADAVNNFTQLFAMTIREPQLKQFFEEMWYGFKLELDATRAEGGGEIDAQHNISKFRPSAGLQNAIDAESMNIKNESEKPTRLERALGKGGNNNGNNR